ncbi:MAG: PAS domain-containing protein, partial [Alphaproteobacteria bacterium]|nr:PAS domain-containing protein [Alphaproteobacteria bacterium]
LFAWYHPDDRDRVMAGSKRALETLEPYDYEARILRPDGSERTVFCHLRITPGEDGTAERVDGTIQDITEQKNAEEALRLNETRLKEAQELANIGSWSRDLRTRVPTCSDQFYRLFEIEPSGDEDPLAVALERFHVEDRERIAQIVRVATETLSPHEYEGRIVLTTGEERILYGRGRFILDKKGRPRRSDGTVQDITERKIAEKALRDNEIRLKEAQELANIGNWSRNLQTGQRIWSDEFYRIFGLEIGQDQDSLGGTIALYHPDDRDRVAQLAREAIETLEPYQYEARIIRPDGSERTILGRTRIFLNERGQPERVDGVIQDITMRKRAEQALRDNETRLNEAQEIGRIGSWSRDLVTSVRTVSRQYLNILGLERDTEIDDMNAIANFFHPDDRERVMQIFDRANAGRQSYEYEARIIRPDGVERVVQVRARVTKNAEDRAIRMDGTIQDITERKQVEQALLATRRALDSNVSAIAITDLDQRIEYANIAFARLWGYDSPDQVIGRKGAEFLAGDSDQIVAGIVDEISKNGRWLGELAGRTVAGNLIPLSVSAQLVRNQEGDPTGLMASFRDLSQERETEAELQREREVSTNLLDAAPVMVLIVDADGKIDYINPAFEQVTGYRLGEVKGTPYIQKFKPDHRQGHATKAFDRSLATSEVTNHRSPIAIKSGEEREIQWVGRTIPGHDNEEQRLLMIGEDITDRLTAEDELKRSRERLVDAQKTGRIGSWDLDLASGDLDWTDEIFRIFEIDRARFGTSYDAFLDAIHPDDRAAVDDAFSRSVTAREPYEIVHRLRMPDGRIKWVEERGRTWYADDGTPQRSAGTVQDISERVEAQQALETTQRFLLEAQSNAHIGSFEMTFPRQDAPIDRQTLEQIPFNWSNEVFHIFGLDPTETDANLAAYLKVIPPEDRDSFATTIVNNLVADGPFSVVRKIYRPNGEMRWIESRGDVVSKEDENFVRMTGTIQDVTERVVAEQELQKSQALLVEAQATARIGSFETIIHYPRAEITSEMVKTARSSWSEEVFRILGLDPDTTMPGFETMDSVTKSIPKASDTPDATLFDNDEYVILREIVRPDGEIRWVEAHAIVTEIDDGRAVRSSGTIQDVTERKQAEFVLEQSRSRLNEAQELANVGSWSRNLATGERTWSDQFYRMCGWEIGAAPDVPIPFVSVFHRDDQQRILDGIRQAIESVEPYEYEARLVRTNGEERVVACRVRVVAGKNGEAVRVDGTIQDITERKLFEQELQRSVVEKETLLREIHHRVKNNLQVISSLLYFQAKKVSNPDDLEVMNESRERLRSMILVHEKLYSSDDLSRVDFGNYVRSLTEQLARSYAGPNRQISLNVDSRNRDLPIELALPCGMIITELLINAYKYAFPNNMQGSINVRCTISNGNLCITVADDGVGLPAEFSETKATSFGWTLITNLARQINGSLTISRSGGTAVTLSIPEPKKAA